MTSATARLGWLQASERTQAAGASLAAAGATVLRVAAGALFLQHGLQKLFGVLGGTAVPLFSMFGVAGVLELVGGLLLIAGFAVRPAALILAVEMIAAYFIAHAPQGGSPVQNGGELPLLYAAIFGFFAVQGAGWLSLDRWIRSRREE
jgi:putative oxidoreductase